MKRVVVTGMGIVSCLGNDTETVLESLREGRSGIKTKQEYIDMGLRSHIAGSVDIDAAALIDRRHYRFMSDAAAFAYIAMQQAVDDSGLTEDQIINPRTGLIAGSGGASTSDVVEVADILRTKGVRRIGPYRVPKTMSSTVSACLATPFQIKGVNYSIASACATSSHCIGNAAEMIQWGKQDIMFAGGCEAPVADATVAGFGRMKALSTRNDDPEGASRPFDADRDGFVVAEGAGTLVLEELEHARRRGARIYAEVCGYGATADGHHITTPSPGGMGAVRAARRALHKAGLEPSDIDLVSAHATATGEGDPTELMGINTLVGEHAAEVSVTATKSSIGHTLGAAGAVAAVATIKALDDGVVPPTLNLHQPDERAGKLDLTPLQAKERDLDVALVNAFGFGGQNSAVVLQIWNG